MIGHNSRIATALSLALFLTGCAIHQEPVVTERPALPAAWESFDLINTVGSCPRISGTYKQIPIIVEMGKKGHWGNEFIGGEWDYAWLLDSPKTSKFQLDQPGREDFFTIEQPQSSSWSLVTTSKTDPLTGIRSLFEMEAQQFSCLKAEMILPKYRYKAGTEGVNFNDLILYSVFINLAGDLLVYEQKHEGRKSTRHRYYRFEKVLE